MTDIILKIAVFAAILAALFFGEQYIEGRGYDRARAEDMVATNKLKAEAAATLASETKKTLDATTKLNQLIAQQEKDREAKQVANRADLRTRQSGPRLQFRAETGRGAGSGGAQVPAPGTTTDAGSAVVQLPEPINGRLRELAADAQSLAIDYGVLYDFVHNPKLTCELRE